MRRPHPAWTAASALLFAGILLGAASCTDVREEWSVYPMGTREDLVLVETCPLFETTDVALDTPILLLFNKPLKASTVKEGTILLGSGRSQFPIRLLLDESLVVIYPLSPLEPNWRYDVYLTADLRDEDDFALTSSISSFSFVTGDPGTVGCSDIEIP